MWLTRLIFLQNFILIRNQRFSIDSDNFWYPDQALASPSMFLFWVCFCSATDRLEDRWSQCDYLYAGLYITVSTIISWWLSLCFFGAGVVVGGSHWFQLGKAEGSQCWVTPQTIWDDHGYDLRSHELWSGCEVLIRFSFHVDKFRIISSSVTDPLTTSRSKKYWNQNTVQKYWRSNCSLEHNMDLDNHFQETQ